MSMDNCGTHIIGPYKYSMRPFHGTANKCCDGSRSCGCCNNCDVSYDFDYGNVSYVHVDWSDCLDRQGSCRITKSQWFIVSEASEPLDTSGDQGINGTFTYIYISGGVYSGEYVLKNRITTDLGNTIEKTVCIKLIGDANMEIPISNPCEALILDNSCMTKAEMITGTYTQKCICDQPYNCLKIKLDKGCGRIISDDIYELPLNGWVTIKSDEQCLEPFNIIIDENSSAHYEIELSY